MLIPVKDNRRIAVVDDNLAVRDSLQLLLGVHGYDVEAFAGSVGLLASAGLGAFDCFVIDLKLGGPDGPHLLSSVRARGFQQPAILISGWEVESLERVAAEAGFVAHVRKPMLITSIVDEIRRVLRPREGRPPD